MAQYQKVEFRLPVPKIGKKAGLTISMAGELQVSARVKKVDGVCQVDVDSIRWNDADITDLVLHCHYMLELRAEVCSLAESIYTKMEAERLEVEHA
ncbi:MAG TPA: hypothetical protein PLS87_11230 [Ferruginibacter sp.]|nr:hypothetical protein [Ferruginibacter sp.]